MTIKGAADFLLSWPRPVKRAVAVGLDVLLCALAVWLAFYLRLDEWVVFSGQQWLAVIISIVLAIPIFIISGLYRAIFRYSGSSALLAVAQAHLVYGLCYATIITFIRIDHIPRTVGMIQPVLLFLLVAASRVVISWWLGGAYAQLLKNEERRNVMIYGAGSAGRQLYQALAQTEMKVVGFLDDDPRLHGHLLFQRTIYPPSAVADLVARHEVADILLAIPSASRTRRNEILSMLEPLPVAVRKIPGLTDVAQGKVQISELRELDIDDLLGREAVAPSSTLLARNIRDKTVMVTGAGGSIGSELCRQILALRPTTLLLIEISEVALYSIHQEIEAELKRTGADTRVVPLLGSVCDAGRLRGILAAWRPDTIYHAAAYKHVPLVEHNPSEGVWNNVFGTLTVASAARDAGVSDFVLISTDKAVRPTNVMGATKRLAEQVLQSMADAPNSTRFSMVRFGNVLGSSGSVVPLFWHQIKTGGPVTITDPEITRYFMTIPEAAQLVIQAGAMARGGEVFVLDMGEPVKIVDLARKMIGLAGLKVREPGGADGDIELAFVGLRPGEKLYEELLIGNNPAPTAHPRIMMANEHHIPWARLQQRLALLRRAIDASDVNEVLQLVQELVPEYTPESRVVDWVHLEQGGDDEGPTPGALPLPTVSLQPTRSIG